MPVHFVLSVCLPVYTLSAAHRHMFKCSWVFCVRIHMYDRHVLRVFLYLCIYFYWDNFYFQTRLLLWMWLRVVPPSKCIYFQVLNLGLQRLCFFYFLLNFYSITSGMPYVQFLKVLLMWVTCNILKLYSVKLIIFGFVEREVATFFQNN